MPPASCMTAPEPGLLPLLDVAPPTDTFLDEVLEGLQATPKRLPSKFFYDAEGSRLFDEITALPEYYPTRTEVGILKRYMPEMARRIGPHALVLEYGSGSSLKTRIVLDHLDAPAGYVPIDISKEHLMQSAARLAEAYPSLTIQPVAADYTTPLELPDFGAENVVVFFPGSTIGNFEPGEAGAFLRRVAQIVGPGGGLLIGADLKKDRACLERAYNDAQGVTAAFNKNVLARINRELGGTFVLNQFRHRAFYNEAHGRIEMHLVSARAQRVTIGGVPITFEEGETIRTEYSHKYSLADFRALADAAGFEVTDVWVDDEQLFSVQYLVAR